MNGPYLLFVELGSLGGYNPHPRDAVYDIGGIYNTLNLPLTDFL